MNSEEFRETFLRTTEKGPPRPRWRRRWRKTTPGERKKPSERQARAVRKKSKEKKQKVPRGSRIAPGGAGEKKPRKRGYSRNESKQRRLRKKKALCA